MNLISGIWKMTWKLAKDYAVKFNNSVSVMAGPAYDYNKDGLADQSFNESRCLSKCFVNFFKNSNTVINALVTKAVSPPCFNYHKY